MSEVRLGDVTIAYDVAGEGEPVVLVAGCGQPAMAWQLGFAPALVEAGYQVVTFDNRGVAPSSAPPAPYSVDQMAGDTVALLDHLGLGPVRMVGHSMGGWITETVAATHPERIRAAVLMGSCNMPTAWEKALTTVERDLARSEVELPRLFYAVETLRYLPQRELMDDDVVEGWLSMIGDLEPWPNPGRLGQYEAALAWSTGAERGAAWGTLSMPVLVVGFEHDTDSPPGRAAEACGRIRGGRFVEIAGAGHLGILTHTAQTVTALVAFFAQT